MSADGVRDHLDGLGVVGPLVFVVVSSLLTVALFPGPLLSGASGLLFGTALGTPVSIAAATLGASLAFSISRWWAHDAVAQLAGPRLERLQRALAGRPFLTVLYARIAPGVPYNLVNYAAGMTHIPLRTFALATAIGVAPRAFAYTALGGSLTTWARPRRSSRSASSSSWAWAAWSWPGTTCAGARGPGPRRRLRLRLRTRPRAAGPGTCSLSRACRRAGRR